ncbi:MAG TPA: 50S ribosomal protein L23 [Patescibacteria group bacterium]
MKFIPVITEKSMKDAADGKFTFWVPMGLTKPEIKRAISSFFGVTVREVRTVSFKAGTKKNIRGRIQKVVGGKKAVVRLTGDEKIDLFTEEKGKKKGKGK